MATLSRKTDGISHGFRVTGRFIGYGVAAFIASQDTRSGTAVNRLQRAFINPKSASEEKGLGLLANMHGKVNKQFEEGLGFLDGNYELSLSFGVNPLQFVERGDDEFFMLDPIMQLQLVGSETMGEAIRRRESEPDRVCPARTFLPYLLRQMVEFCATDPRFFEADLST